MKKFTYLLMAFLLIFTALPLAAPVAAQADTIASQLVEYNKNLPKGYGLITAEELNALLAEKPVTVVDVREVAEFATGHLKDSINIPIRDLAKNLNLLPDLNANIVVLCKVGFRGAQAMAALQILGYSNVKSLKSGYDAWVAAKLETTQNAVTPKAGTAPAVNADMLKAVDAVLSGLPAGFGGVAAKDLAAELADNAPILIDVRTKEEWDKGYIKGATLIPINDFMSRESDWPKDKNAKIVVYCGSAHRGGIAMVMLRLMGYANVRNLSGGTAAWVAAGLPLEGAPAAAAFNVDTYFSDYLKSLPDTFNAVKVADLEAELKTANKPFLVDVRTADEYAEGFIEGAINIPIQELTKHLDLLPDLNQNIVVYCGSGHRSAIAMTALNLLGYTKVRSMLSGTSAWAAAKFPLSKEAVTLKPGKAPTFKPEVFEMVDKFITAIPAGYYTIKPTDLSVALIEKAPFLMDVRTEAEWKEGYIKGAALITFRDLMTRMKDWPADKSAPIVIYDNPTHRSTMAMVLLRMKGYTDVRVLGGGTGAWVKANLPLTK
jgi:rhodanese-related sulfurtransferase